jgi:hypothetical protein
VVVSGPQIYGSKLVGWVDGKYREMPVADLRNVIMQGPAPARTAALVGMGVVGLGVAAFLLTGTGNSQNPCDLDSSECET